MSRWGRWGRWREEDWYPAQPKKPPPTHGIKVRALGATWWGKRWIEAIERVSKVYATRLSRGRVYARQGRVHDLVVKPRRVRAQVTGSADAPYEVMIRIPALADAAWAQAIDVMAAKAQFAADLYAGAMPKAIDEAFRATGASLFPLSALELVTSCTCPDWGAPCKHVAATLYVIGEALDKDPFLLFALRGRAKEQVLAALRAARGHAGEGPAVKRRVMARAPKAMDPALPVAFAKVSGEAYDAWRALAPALHLSLERPAHSGALLRQLGEPPSWSVGASPAELLTPLVRAASERALTLALGETEVIESVPG